MRSVVVVFPASMCAMIPMLRVFSSVTLRAMTCLYVVPIPSRKKALSGPGAGPAARGDRVLGHRLGRRGERLLPGDPGHESRAGRPLRAERLRAQRWLLPPAGGVRGDHGLGRRDRRLAAGG